MSKTVSESIWASDKLVVPLADVQHIEKLKDGLWLITKHTRWNFEHDVWDNPIYISSEKAESFMRSWCVYRHELESDSLMNISDLAAASAGRKP